MRAVDRDNATIWFNEPDGFPFGAEETTGSGRRWWIENAGEIEVAAHSGAWRIDAATEAGAAAGSVARLTYAPFPGEAFPAAVEVAALGASCALYRTTNTPAMCGALLDARGSSGALLEGLEFRNLRFVNTASSWSGDGSQAWEPWGYSHAVHASWTAGIVVRNCSWRGVGFGLNIMDAVPGRAASPPAPGPGPPAPLEAPRPALIDRCSFSDVGGAAVSIRRSAGAVFNDSWVVGFGSEFFGAAAVGVQESPNSRLAHLDVSGGDHNGLEFNSLGSGSAGSVVSLSRFHDSGRQGSELDSSGTSDFGAFHAASWNSTSGYEFHHNVFANITAWAHGGGGLCVKQNGSTTKKRTGVI